MDAKTGMKELLAALYKAPPATAAEVETGRAKIRVLDNGLTAYVCGGEEICKFYSEAQALDGRRISTREARLLSWEELSVEEEKKARRGLAVIWQQAGLTLRQEILLWEEGELEVRLALHDEGKETATRYMVPFATPYPDGRGNLFSCHWIRRCCWFHTTTTCGFDMNHPYRPAGGRAMTSRRFMMSRPWRGWWLALWIFRFGKTRSAGPPTMREAFWHIAELRTREPTTSAPMSQ